MCFWIWSFYLSCCFFVRCLLVVLLVARSCVEARSYVCIAFASLFVFSLIYIWLLLDKLTGRVEICRTSPAMMLLPRGVKYEVNSTLGLFQNLMGLEMLPSGGSGAR